MKSVGPLYVDTLKLKHPLFPIFEWGWSQETEHPYRESAACLVFWVPFIPRGYAIGIWGEPVHEDAALAKAIRKLDADTEEVKRWAKLDIDDVESEFVIKPWHGGDF